MKEWHKLTDAMLCVSVFIAADKRKETSKQHKAQSPKAKEKKRKQQQTKQQQQQQKHNTAMADEEFEVETTPGYQAPKKVDLDTLQELDKDDEALNRWKAALLEGAETAKSECAKHLTNTAL